MCRLTRHGWCGMVDSLFALGGLPAPVAAVAIPPVPDGGADGEFARFLLPSADVIPLDLPPPDPPVVNLAAPELVALPVVFPAFAPPQAAVFAPVQSGIPSDGAQTLPPSDMAKAGPALTGPQAGCDACLPDTSAPAEMDAPVVGGPALVSLPANGLASVDVPAPRDVAPPAPLLADRQPVPDGPTGRAKADAPPRPADVAQTLPAIPAPSPVPAGAVPEIAATVPETGSVPAESPHAVALDADATPPVSLPPVSLPPVSAEPLFPVASPSQPVGATTAIVVQPVPRQPAAGDLPPPDIGPIPLSHVVAVNTASDAGPAPSPVALADLPVALVTQAQDVRMAEILLHPAELGRMRFELAGDGADLHLTLCAEQPATLDMLRRHAAELAAEFRTAGFVQVSIGFGQWAQGGGRGGQPAPQPVAALPAPAAGLATAPVTLLRPVWQKGLNLRL